jgi:hypothetical protein
VRKIDAIKDDKLRNTKNARKAISHRVIDTGNRAARKFSGRASEASTPLSLPEMSLASTPKEHGARRIVALCVLGVNRVAVLAPDNRRGLKEVRPSPDRRKMMELLKSL